MIKLYVDYVYTEDSGEGFIFLNESHEVIGTTSANDADWRDEYFNPIFNKIGVVIESSGLPDEELEKMFSEY